MMPILKTCFKGEAVSAREIPVGHLAKDLENEIFVIKTSDGLVFLPGFTHWPLDVCREEYIDCGKIEIE
jgi:hypothetical protein